MFFFFNDTATTEIYTLSLHDALPIYVRAGRDADPAHLRGQRVRHEIAREVGGRDDVELVGPGEDLLEEGVGDRDRKSTRLNSSHSQISYAVFRLKKKKYSTHTHIYSV